jgi:hypothetical protein
MNCAEVSYEEAGEVPVWNQSDVSGLSTNFKTLTVQCLIASDYTNPVAYTVETLMLHIQFDGMALPDRSIETPLMLGIAIRLAMRMGIHRNSNTHPGLTPFQGEMRRRLWSTLLISDTMHSLQLSLPAHIDQIDYNCGIPRNIRNHEFGPDSTELPHSRPLSEHTEATYTILKSRLLLVLKDITNLTNYNNNPSEEQIYKCETSLSEAHATIPPYLQVSHESGSVSAIIRSQRISFDRVYQLNRCMLYRKYLRRARQEPAVMRRRLSCIDAALKSLHLQATLFVDFNPMFSPSLKRRHKSAQPTVDFFLAGMVIALDLYYGFNAPPILDLQGSGDPSDRAEMIAALENSTAIWGLSKDTSIESAKAYGIFSFVLQKVGCSELSNEIGRDENAREPDPSTTETETPSTVFRLPESGVEFDWVS